MRCGGPARLGFDCGRPVASLVRSVRVLPTRCAGAWPANFLAYGLFEARAYDEGDYPRTGYGPEVTTGPKWPEIDGGLMTKADIVHAVYSKVGGFSKKESADLVDLVFETLKETLGRGEKVKISGFGNFVLRDKRQRQGRNPQTGEPIIISRRRVLSFKASQLLKQALNGDGAVLGSDAAALCRGGERKTGPVTED
jgi:integration host factor subunit alpha